MQATQAIPTDNGAPPLATVPAAALRFAVVELFGHQRIAGAVSEHAFGGCAMVRVDVPTITVTETVYPDQSGASERITRTIPGHTRSLGPAAIYSINWCDEAGALVAAMQIKHEPMRPYSLRVALAGMPEGERQRVLALTASTINADDTADLPF